MANTIKFMVNELIRIFNVSRTLGEAGFNDMSISSPASLDIMQRNASSQWVNRPPTGTEASTTPVAGLNDTVVGTANRFYSPFTLPTTASFYLITGIEWLNGTVVNGAVMAHVERVNAVPISSSNTTMLAWIATVTQTGTSAVQRASQITSFLIQGGTPCGASIVSNSATARFGTTTVASTPNLRANTYNVNPGMGGSTSIANGTEEPYIKVYYTPVLGV